MNDQPLERPPRVDQAHDQALALGFAMSSDDRTGALLRTLAASKPGGHLLEIGTGTGAGAAWLAAGMNADARLTTIESNPQRADAARRVLADDPRVQVVADDAAHWLSTYAGEPFDLVFVDWRVGKFDQRALLLGHLAPGGLYVGDDLLAQPTWPGDHGPRVERFLAEIVEEPALVVTLMSWSSGLVVAAQR